MRTQQGIDTWARRASGDNKKILTAERVAFLDWENPDATGKPVRRPWSPPTDKKALADRSANA